MSTALVMLSIHLILWCPLLLLPSIFPRSRDFSSESAVHIRWPKYWSFSITSSREYLEFISLKIDWFHLLVVQGTLRSLHQHHSLKISILWHSAFFMVQISQLRDHWKDHSLNYAGICWQNNVSVFNTLSRFSIAFLMRSNCLLISWLQSHSAVILECKKRKSVTTSIFPLFICHQVMMSRSYIFNI